MLRFVMLLLSALVLTALPAHATETVERKVDAGRGRNNTSVDISAHASGSSPDLGVAPVVVRHGTGGGGDPIVHVDCTTIPVGAPVTPEILRDCAVPTPRIGGPLDAVATTQAQAASYAIDYFRSIELPVPRPTMSARRGVCGAVHTLDLAMPTQMVFSDPETPFGPLVLHVSARVVIDWGDHSTTTTASIKPTPHSWTTKGSYTITATVHWQARWSFGDVSGVLSGPVTTGSQPDWPVVPIQAVITEG